MEKQKKAVALGYTGGKSVPEILAVARGLLVERLLKIAEENSITVYRNADLAETLSALGAGSPVPESLYRAVAEVLAYCYRVNEAFREKLDSGIRGDGNF